MDRHEVFDDDYLYFYETFLTCERSDREADLIWRLLESSPRWTCSTSRAGTDGSRTGLRSAERT